ncbi:hypothetical protein CRU87_05675 [Aliarcobacter trophiarum LMG 25534]|uniref:Uncharacterized protein n=1 Tax=Aliarcobacter trophiarum LMG 25534 TaxID=1032241 RepID=A0AAD0VM10_9BACT|nr:hypothetical protein [Aliarcobacter trophiarum]AXK48724.1 hypothetical protein ATR_0856 [Aliarcobacter trophiarum LMG 25534]RXI28281.1 hypothetical protein CRU89_01740 [Aliarcobacter trophiarum]RXJ91332.1 hypothetical protein CRU87_05675 [Aliarcobacter trophiarum LMG 25534]
MKRRTKNFVEDILIILSIFFILYLIYFFAFKQDDELSLESIKNETKVEIVTQEKEIVSESSFLKKVYEEIKEKIFQDTNEDETSSIKQVEKKEESIKNIHLSQRAEILSKQDERVRELSVKEQISDEPNIEVVKQEEIKDSSSEKVEEKLEEKATIEEKTTIEEKKEEQTEQAPLETKVYEEIKTDENSDEAHNDIGNIDEFFYRFDKKVYSNIDRSFDKTSFKRGEFVNIRVTILKDGSYEQLTFLNGNSEYFNKIKPQIEQMFPLNIEENLKGHFPRYYRMKIDF